MASKFEKLSIIRERYGAKGATCRKCGKTLVGKDIRFLSEHESTEFDAVICVDCAAAEQLARCPKCWQFFPRTFRYAAVIPGGNGTQKYGCVCPRCAHKVESKDKRDNKFVTLEPTAEEIANLKPLKNPAPAPAPAPEFDFGAFMMGMKTTMQSIEKSLLLLNDKMDSLAK